jgi:quinoprotein glucose dehydrogenase
MTTERSRRYRMRLPHPQPYQWAIRALLAICIASPLAAPAQAREAATGWPEYGGDAGGIRYSSLTDITPANISRLEIAWTYRTGNLPTKAQQAAFEATPILADDTLYFSTPFNTVIALDAEAGTERWRYDPHLDLSVRYSDFTSRGVAAWLDPARAAGEPCRRRIFHATNDARLLALDAASGQPCADFGNGGIVDLSRGVGKVHAWEYGVSSAPTVVHDLVIVGSKVADNNRIDAPSGVVRAYDTRNGKLRWSWDPVPSDVPGPTAPSGNGPGFRLGSANAWAPFSVDVDRDLLFVPTGNTSPDYFGGLRHGSDFYSSSVVALRASTGEVVWHFQTVHHDLWDYDVPAQPALITVRRDGTEIPAVAQATKMGFVFVLDRATGAPLLPIEERPVPQTDVPGESTAPTQPFPLQPPHLVPTRLTPDEAWGVTPWDRSWCRKRIAALRNDGIFTPPSLQGSLMYPGNAGGTNWGSVAFEPTAGLLVVNSSNLPFIVQLIPRDKFAAEKAANPGVEFAPQIGTPYGMRREPFLSPLGLPCNPPPWGTLAAIDVASGALRWQVPLGTTRDLLPIPITLRLGTPNLGGPIVTASGLVFIGAAMDNYLRAFDLQTGEELWKGRLPAGGQATPMTYRLREGGRQFVVIAAGGHGRGGTTLGDYVVAFALP